MNDRELLEMAAKAAGVDILYNRFMNYPVLITGNEKDGDPVVPWNPLTDDGDSLRLVTKLGLDVYCSTNPKVLAAVCTVWDQNMDVKHECTERHTANGVSPDEATRRAIVRAAAEIGAGMRPFSPVEEIHQMAGTDGRP